MMNFEPYNILAGIIFGTIGWGAFMFGRRLDLTYPKIIGIVLMAYPYFIQQRVLIWLVGVVLLILLWIKRHE